MDNLKIGVDRLKLSVSGWVLRSPDVSGKQIGKQHGFDWYDCGLYTIGFSPAYAVIELGALWFLQSGTDGFDIWSAVSKQLYDIFDVYQSPKISRIDIYVDYYSKVVSELHELDYSGKAKVKTNAWRSDSRIETSYLSAASGSFVVRRYDKTQEINDKDIAHRYPEEYQTGVVRCEIEYNKSMLKSLQSRDYYSVLNYIGKHLSECAFDEAHVMLDELVKVVSLEKVNYKASTTGELNGRRTKDRIFKALEQLHSDFIALSSGDDREFFTRLAQIAEKKVTIQV
jgi:hypothetical protein